MLLLLPRILRRSLAGLVVAGLACACATPGLAQWVETVYVPTTRTVVYEPTSYVVPTTYYATSYVVPTAYYATSYVVPTTYYTTTTARYVATSYVPTVYVPTTSVYVPTTSVVDAPVLATSATICCTPQPVACPTEVSSVPVPSQGTSSAANGGAEPTLSPEAAGAKSPIRSTPKQPAAGAPKDEAAPQGGANAGEADIPAPTTPAPDGVLEPPAGEGVEERRDALRPAATTARSTLLGKVVSAVDGKPVPGVVVTASDARQRFKDRTATTSEQGTFELVLPEGDWTVQVPLADGGRTLTRSITVAGGLITDEKNGQVTTLTVAR